ncbi:MAG: hypothetical protein ACFB21_05225 [Opitutales bacterium]
MAESSNSTPSENPSAPAKTGPAWHRKALGLVQARIAGLEPVTEATLGMLVLRLWLGVRALAAGIEKFAGTRSAEAAVEIGGEPNDYGLTETASEKVYGFEHYAGVPDALYPQFEAEPLIPGFFLGVYDFFLGPLLLLLGLALLLGVATRTALVVTALLYTSLTFGLILLNQSAGVAWLGIHIGLIVGALLLVRHNRFELLKMW